jgi:glyoxylase-like metal-dependent hydrolase (beta-lactamase superfamily II)
MSTDSYEIFAIKYAQHARRSPANFVGGDDHDVDMPLFYYVWVVKGGGRTIVVDTGFNFEMAMKRGRTITRPVAEGLNALGVAPEQVEDVVITHLHYDHVGNHALFPKAKYYLQDKEMDFATGRCMCHPMMNHGYEVDDVTEMVRRVYENRVQFVDGVREIAPGIEVHHIGGHTRGLQAVRVRTNRGWVVLASDASHFYAHMEQDRAFPILYNLGDMVEGYNTLRRLATSRNHIVPGHDPLVMDRYPAAWAGAEGWIVRLDAQPMA